MAFKSLKAWKILRRSPKMSAGQLAIEMQMPRHLVREILYLMLERGWASCEGANYRRHYFAGQKPEDMRGMHPNSMKGQRIGWENLPNARARWSELSSTPGYTQVKRPRDKALPAEKSVFVGKIALETCWSIAQLPQKDTQDDVDQDNEQQAA